MRKIGCIDLGFQGHDGVIASYVIDTGKDGLALVESGPHSTIEALKRGLGALGFALNEVRHVFLTHIHLDHAGGAWALAALGARVYVHPVGLPHLMDPSKLVASATRLYGDNMDRLWGQINPIAPNQLRAVADGEVIRLGNTTSFEAIYTPGHARHHIAWRCNSEHLFTGDLCGIQLNEGPIIAPCPPPDIELADWNASLKRIEKCSPQYLHLTHYGSKPYRASFLEAVRASYCQSAAVIAKSPHKENLALLQKEFAAHMDTLYQDAALSSADRARYEAANPTAMSVSGLLRYLRKNPTSASELEKK